MSHCASQKFGYRFCCQITLITPTFFLRVNKPFKTFNHAKILKLPLNRKAKSKRPPVIRKSVPKSPFSSKKWAISPEIFGAETSKQRHERR